MPEQRFRRAYLHLQYSYADLHQLRDTPPTVHSLSLIVGIAFSKLIPNKNGRYSNIICYYAYFKITLHIVNFLMSFSFLFYIKRKKKL
ncbi:hypothetical protein BWD13_07310 [Leptospira santarosai serovar Grippotyphosa]|nr:hypothetical protein BWD13_07310 [Leptospira santarosai serovar Grippotyphosa]